MKNPMLNREDMLELTRRMTVARNSFTRVAGSYRDENGEDDGSFNIHFQKLKKSEMEKNLKIAKAIPYAETNANLKEYAFPGKMKDSLQLQQLLLGINSCGLKNDALMEILYEQIAERYASDEPYAIFVFHNCYDVPVKTKDNEWLEGSEEVYEFLICAVCPLEGEYEPGLPEWGFLYPSFKNRSSDPDHIAVFEADGKQTQEALLEMFL